MGEGGGGSSRRQMCRNQIAWRKRGWGERKSRILYCRPSTKKEERNR